MILDITPYIRELILSNECVILRRFGGFDTSYRNALLDKNKGLILPPGKKITFRSDWTVDNGTLEKYIASTLHINSKEASKFIDLFVDNLLARLENEDAIQLEGIGNFKKGKSGTIEFHELEDETYLADSFGLDTLDIEKEPPKKETLPVNEIQPIIPQRRKMTGWYVGTGLLLLFIMVATIILISGKEGISIFNFKGKSEKTDNKSDIIIFGKKGDVLEDSVTRTIEQALDKRTNPKKALSPEESAKVSGSLEMQNDSDHTYFLVAGSFKNIKYAELLKTKLENKGFKTEILANEGSYAKVIIGKFNDKNAAINELQRIRGQINQSVWLMEK